MDDAGVLVFSGQLSWATREIEFICGFKQNFIMLPVRPSLLKLHS